MRVRVRIKQDGLEQKAISYTVYLDSKVESFWCESVHWTQLGGSKERKVWVGLGWVASH